MISLPKIDKRFSEKILFMALSFFFALFLWFQTSSEKIYEAEIKVSLNLDNLPTNLVIISDIPKEVLVRVRASGKNLLKLKLFSGSSFNCVLNLSDISVGDSGYFLSESNLSIPKEVPSLNVVSIYPGRLMIKTKVKREKEVKVLADSFSVSFRDGYTGVGDLIIEPPKVKVFGPKEDLKLIKYLQVGKKVLENVDKTISVEMPLPAYKKKYVTFSPRSVTITQKTEKLQTRKISNLPVTIKNLSKRYKAKIIPSNATVIFSGPISYINRLTISDISVEINGSKLKEGNYSLIAEIKFPEKEINLLEVSPTQFNVIIEKK